MYTENNIELTVTPNTNQLGSGNDTSDIFVENNKSTEVHKLVSLLTSSINNFSPTSTVNNVNVINDFSPTSIEQNGGNLENNDINSITSTILENSNNIYSPTSINQDGGNITTSTNTIELENELRTLLQNNSENLQGGGKKSSRKSSKKSSRKSSKKSSRKSKSKRKSTKRRSRKSQKGGDNQLIGGAKKSKKSSRKSSRKSKKLKGGMDSCPPCPPCEKKQKKKRKPNPGFMAFQELKKYVAGELNIPNSVKAAKAAGGALRAVKERHPDITAVEASKKAMKEFDENKNKYAELAK